MVTYSELFQFCTFIVALVGLCYTIFKQKNSRPLLAIVNGLLNK
mgnify:CR=1 FL=1